MAALPSITVMQYYTPAFDLSIAILTEGSCRRRAPAAQGPGVKGGIQLDERVREARLEVRVEEQEAVHPFVEHQIHSTWIKEKRDNLGASRDFFDSFAATFDSAVDLDRAADEH